MGKYVKELGIEVSKEVCLSIAHKAAVRKGWYMVIVVLVCAPLVLGGVLFGLALSVASFVFGIQALVVGSQTYADPFQDNCQNTLGVWMIVFGSLAVGKVVLKHTICSSSSKQKECKERQSLPDDGSSATSTDSQRCGDCDEDCGDDNNGFINLLEMAIFGWLCYGVHMLYSHSTPNFCVESQVQVFTTMVMFLFWGSVAMMAAFCTIMVTGMPFLAALWREVQAEKVRQDATKPKGGGGMVSPMMTKQLLDPEEQV